MRFRKGNKVEVFNRRDVPSGSWWCAEIISGNGHNYIVRYDRSPSGSSDGTLERVSRKAMRPCPPLVSGPEIWVCGDVVEVFDNYSWKIAEVLKVVSKGRYYFVRLLGSSQEFKVLKSDVRVRQSWVDNQWVVIGKDSRNCEHGKTNNQSPGADSQKQSCQVLLPDVKWKARVGDDHLQNENNIGSQKKRSNICSSHVEAHAGPRQKIRAIGKEGSCQRLVLEHPSPFLEKVDAVASPRTMLGEKYMHASFNNRTIGFSEIYIERGKTTADDRCYTPRSLESHDAENIACSVASCGLKLEAFTPCFQRPQDDGGVADGTTLLYDKVKIDDLKNDDSRVPSCILSCSEDLQVGRIQNVLGAMHWRRWNWIFLTMAGGRRLGPSNCKCSIRSDPFLTFVVAHFVAVAVCIENLLPVCLAVRIPSHQQYSMCACICSVTLKC
ncbi:uncharacterized protein LOC131223248 isoform X2 [Magnolia sinica]|uniref:uncharacterized protein LOC131223248 isoform X2 n=1 Tax=Magnolia sinica TaxID=86752 RepID=UPI002658F606|nr:uncharacterized protein LOC131223248 isoform X2 [Magnolia sinica]